MTELMKAQQTQLAVSQHPEAMMALGLEFLDEEDKRIRPARLKIAHQDDPDVGQNGVKAGEFYNAKTGVVYGNSLLLAFLHFTRKTRAAYKEPYEADAPLLCASDDSKMPRESTPRRPLTNRHPGPCDTCAWADWENADGTRKRRPECSEQHNFMLNIDVGDNAWDKVLLMLQKTRVPAAGVLRELAQGSMYQRYLFATTKREKGDSGAYYVPLFSFGDRFTPEQREEVLFLARGSHAAYAAGEIYVGADEGDDEGDATEADPHAPTAAESAMPWDNDDDVAPASQPSVLEPPPARAATGVKSPF